KHGRCKVEPNHSAAAAGKAAGERSSACAEVYHPLSSMADAMGGEAIEERAGKPRAMAAVVFGGRGEVEGHTSGRRLAAKGHSKGSAKSFRVALGRRRSSHEPRQLGSEPVDLRERVWI